MSKFNAYQLRKWSVLVRRRDGVCMICGSRERLEAHHINSKSYFPEQAYDLENGIALCGDNKRTGHRCHDTFHVDFMSGTRKKCTAKDWGRFVEVVRWAHSMRLPALTHESPD